MRDRSEGGFIFWQDSVSGKSRVSFQTFDRNNRYLLGAGGVYISPPAEEQVNPVAFAHLPGSSVLLWENTDAEGKTELAAQRFSLKGKPMWEEGGVHLSNGELNVDEYRGTSAENGTIYIFFTESAGMSGGILSGIRFFRITSSGYAETPVNGEMIYRTGSAIRQLSISPNSKGSILVSWLENTGKGEVLKALMFDPETGEQVTKPQTISHATQRVLSYTMAAADDLFYLCWQTMGKGRNIYHEVLNGSGKKLMNKPLEEAVKTPGTNSNPQVFASSGEVVISWLNDNKGNVSLLLSKIRLSGDLIKNEYINVFGVKENTWRYGQVLYPGNGGEVILSWFEGRKGASATALYVQRFSKSLVPLLAGGPALAAPSAASVSYIWFFPDAVSGVLAVYKEKSEKENAITAKYLRGASDASPAVTDIAVQASGDSVTLRWSVVNESQISLMQLERYEAEGDEGWVVLAEFTPQSFSPEQNYSYSHMPYVYGNVDYRVVLTAKSGDVITSGAVTTKVTPVLTSDIKLFQNTPNPFSSVTVIPFFLAEAMEVKIEIYNSRIERVRLYEIPDADEGLNKLEISADDLSPGVYFYRFTAGEYKEVKKMVVSRE
ncbi:MAG: T9SS type A sorting domain-containing protein [Ignavibacteriales bacterium]|nr:T9SS type A sorting domain-containing protein [Ignavibacteriaceae bacterium]QOJ30299.1 MAG: T9SS type A sorting domain-containing protein [Ignavibacteriales bacterium]